MQRFWEEAIWSREVAGPGHGKSTFRAADFKEAQPYCNFVVMAPGWLPEGCHLGSISVRTEGDRWASVHFRLHGQARQLRIKQFHYDWWTLTESGTNLVGSGLPFAVRGTVGWHGTDYKGQPASCWGCLRTQVEVSVERGSFEPGEIEELCARMEPADAEAADLIARVPFARISHTVRRGEGPWGYDKIAGHRWTTDLIEAIAGCNMPALEPEYLPAGFAFDSAGWRPSAGEGRGGSFQAVFRHTGNWTDCLHLRGTQPGAPDPIAVPPDFTRLKLYQWQRFSAGDTTFHVGSTLAQDGTHSYLSPYGGHRAIWAMEGVNWECSSRASVVLSLEPFLGFVSSLRLASPGGERAGREPM